MQSIISSTIAAFLALMIASVISSCGDGNDRSDLLGSPGEAPRWTRVSTQLRCPDSACNISLFEIQSDGSITTESTSGPGNRITDVELRSLTESANRVVQAGVTGNADCRAVDELAESQSVALVPVNRNSVIVFDSNRDTDEICTRGGIENAQSLANQMRSLALKYGGPSPTPSTSPSPS